ncbi:MAG TPA: hypothetical protein P5550_06285 [Bacteroidales bacterium]|nr:hypothetical protein [Bacteroidales bacterium]HRZ77167.1 hypothetical protein [Bacteroidales bacterium]
MSRIGPTGKVFVAMVVVVLLAGTIAWRYYHRLNRQIDPRIAQARELYGSYNTVVASHDYVAVLALLDSADHIYSRVQHYVFSWERGVLWNNRAALCLTLALSADSIPAANNPFPALTPDSLIALTGVYLLNALSHYQKMEEQYGGKTSRQVEALIQSEFLQGLDHIPLPKRMNMLEARAREIVQASAENNRRMSVCYTNLGIVSRYREDYPQAVNHYQTALRLWDRNLEAENNLNRLLGLPLKKRNLLQRLFPPQRKTEKTNQTP